MTDPTQSRIFAGTPSEYYYVQNGSSYKGNFNASGSGLLYSGDQTTTSYRSHRGISLDTTGDGFEQSSGSQVAFAKELQADAVQSGTRGLFNYGFTAFDNGHEFATKKTTYSWFSQPRSMYAPGSQYGDLEYHGSVLAINGPTPPSITLPSDGLIAVDGSRLFKEALPTKPEAGLLQFIAETRQDVPRILGESVLQHGAVNRHSAGDEFLNLQFGLIPTWSDIKKLAQSTLHAGKLLRQYRDNANREVRRRRSLPTVSTVTELVGPEEYPSIGSFFGVPTTQLFWVSGPQLAKTLVTDVTQTSAWFSGAFTYYMNEGHSILDRLDRYEEQANHLLGTRFSADTFWELSPFSWLADWYSDTGTFISNVVALDNDELVMRYGYVMHETRATRTFLKTGLTPREGSGAPATLRLDVEIVQKLRHRASPYGFGLTDTDLTLRQQAILAALGMTSGSGSRVL